MTRRVLWLAITGLLLVGTLVVYTLPSADCRYMCDDFVDAVITRQHGILGGMSFMYSNLTGRYTGIVFYNLYDALGQGAVPWTPLAGLLVLLATLAWALRPLFAAGPLRLPGSLAVSTLFVLVFLQQVPNLFQFLYWPATALTYLLPIGGITVLAGLALRLHGRTDPPRHPWRERLGIWLAVFAVAGFTETYAVAMLAALGLILSVLVIRSPRRGHPIGLVLGSAVTTCLSLAVQVASPGLAIRGDLRTVSLGPVGVVTASLVYAAKLFLAMTLEQPVPLLALALGVSLVVARGRTEVDSSPRALPGLVLRVALAAGMAVLVMGAAMTPSFQALGRHPYNRVLTTPVWVFVSFWMVLGVLLAPLWTASFGTRRRLPVSLAGVLLLAGVGFSGWNAYQQVAGYWPGIRQYRVAWDERDRAIMAQLAAGRRDVEVEALPAIRFVLDGGAREVGPDPDLWLNQTVASYYGADSIVTPPTPRPRRRAGRGEEDTAP